MRDRISTLHGLDGLQCPAIRAALLLVKSSRGHASPPSGTSYRARSRSSSRSFSHSSSSPSRSASSRSPSPRRQRKRDRAFPVRHRRFSSISDSPIPRRHLGGYQGVLAQEDEVQHGAKPFHHVDLYIYHWAIHNPVSK